LTVTIATNGHHLIKIARSAPKQFDDIGSHKDQELSIQRICDLSHELSSSPALEQEAGGD